jgi:hypothetical protein
MQQLKKNLSRQIGHRNWKKNDLDGETRSHLHHLSFKSPEQRRLWLPVVDQQVYPAVLTLSSLKVAH